MSGPITRGRRALLAWYAPRAGAYPWRGVRDPYLVLVSEVMLQQTQASRVVPAYRSFVSRFPTVAALAAAPRADVLREWGSLGYPRRAVGLHETARAIVREHDGVVPHEPSVLERLPGIGPYTAAAVASLGFGAAVPALDVNVRRVVGRVVLGRDDGAAREVRGAAERWIDPASPAAWNQALMDVGREHCRPRPRCDGCPLARACRFRTNGVQPAPVRRRQPPYEGSMRQLRGTILALLRGDGRVTFGSLVGKSGRSREEVRRALAGLVGDGLASAERSVLAGSPRGRVSLPR